MTKIKMKIVIMLMKEVDFMEVETVGAFSGDETEAVPCYAC